MISDGFVGGEESSTTRKKHARNLRAEKEVMLAEVPSKKTKSGNLPITFTEAKVAEIHQPHDDSLVISVIISKFRTWRALIDSGSLADILF